MNLLIYFLQKTVGQKIVIGLTGLGLSLFILIHMLGNLLILSGPSAYNKYAHKLHEFPGFILLELGLLLFFTGHIV
ncbi:MAG: succinate dehydrogenase, partial [Oligoflexia bacterium]|nr:succinate dehydrogenase [Oligoflexia bacterium]